MRPRRSTEPESRKKRIANSGFGIVEFALVAPVFLLLIFGIIEFSRVMLMYHHVGNAAREGSRYASVHGSTSSDATTDNFWVQKYVRSISALDPNDMNVSTTWPDGNKDPGSRVKVKVEYPFTFILPIWFGSGFQMTSTSEMVISY